jgi:hypothetical protein
MNIQIGELAKRTACPVVTIRFYEQEGLLPPPGRSRGIFACMARSTWSACSSFVTAGLWICR